MTQEITENKLLTRQQQKALHCYFGLLADTLNEAGLDQRIVLKPSIQIRWNKESIKEYLWKPIQYALLGKQSTTELLKKQDIDKCYDTLHKHLSEKFGSITDFPQFPSQEEVFFREQHK